MSSITRERVGDNLFRRKTASGVVFEVRFKSNGQSIRRTLEATSLRAAKKEAADVQAAFRQGAPEVMSRRTGDSLLDLYEAYIADIKATVSPNTLTNYGYWFRHLEPLHNVSAQAITRDDVKALERSLRPKMAPSSLATIMRLGSAIVGHAEIDNNPFAGPRGKAKRRSRRGVVAAGPKRNLSPEDLDALVAGATDLQRPLLAMLAETGARVSEIVGLVWNDIDLDAPTVRFSAQLVGGERAPLKSEAQRNPLALSERLTELLRQHRQVQMERGVYGRDAFVFASANGLPMDRRRVHRIAQAAARKAHLIVKGETVRVHDLRAAFACRQLEAGTGVNVVQSMLGHSSPAMTLSYARLVSGEQVLAPTPLIGSEPAEVIEIKKRRVA
jgi:integrase